MIKLTEVKRIQTHNERRQETNTHNFFKERYFNADKIENFTQLNGVTYLFMSTSSSAFEVAETPEEIIKKIANAGVIKNESN